MLFTSNTHFIVVGLLTVWLIVEAYRWIKKTFYKRGNVEVVSYKQKWTQNVDVAYTKQDYLDLAWLYHNAPVQTYDTVKKAIEYYHKAYEHGSHDALYQLGKLHFYGVPNVLPADLDQAKLYMNQLYLNGDAWQKALAHDALDMIAKECEISGPWTRSFKKQEYAINHQTPLFYTQLSSSIGYALDNHVKGHVQFDIGDDNLQLLPRCPRTMVEGLETPQTCQVQERIREPVDGRRRRSTILRPLENVQQQQAVNEPQVFILNDQHNVHDTGVVNSVKVSINNLEELAKDNWENQEATINDLETYITECTTLGNQQKQDASEVLNRIKEYDSTITSVNKHETEILDLVLKRIHHHDNIDHRDTLMKNLVQNLADAKENDSIVCPTGRVARIVDALNTIDEHVQIKPDWALRQEMLARASKLRDELLDKSDESTRHDIENGVDRPEFDDLFKTSLREELERTYVDTGLVSRVKLDAELGEWIDHIM